MPSVNDNFQIRDANANIFKMRSKDISPLQDGSVQQVYHLAQAYPVNYGTGGCYSLTSKSGTMSAGLAAGSPIYAFRWTSTLMNAILRKVIIHLQTGNVGFAAGIMEFDLFRAIGWTGADSGGATDTLGSVNGNLRSAMPASVLTEIRHSSTAALTPGTRTLDAQAHDLFLAQAATAASTLITTRGVVFDKSGQADHPLVMAANEGFVVQATVPATGTWGFMITPYWEEVPIANY